MSTCIAGGGRLRGPLPVILVVLAALLLWLVDPAFADQQAPPDRTLRLSDIAILPDDPGTQALVRRHLPLAFGQPLDVTVLSLARQSLEETGYFREVILYTSRGRSPGQVVLHVEVELDRRIRFLTGFGYDPMDGWYLNFLGASLLNRPRAGSEVRLAWRDGYNIGGVYLEGRVPVARRPRQAWLFDFHVQQKLWFAYEQRESWSQNVISHVLRLGREVPLGDRSRLAVWLGYDKIDPDEKIETYFDEEDQQRPASDLISADLADAEYLNVWLEGAWSNRDPVRPWWRGSWLGGRMRLSHDLAGTGFYTVELDGRRTLPLGETTSLAGRLRAAHTGADTPYHQRFQFGGIYSVRGYDFAYLSGPLGASELVQANLELRAALLDRRAPLPRVTGVFFLDTGQAWDAEGDSYGWVLGGGFGIRVRLPWVQSIGLEVGYPLVKLDDISPVVVNIALGWSY
jgi:outer membrane protein assembly factor BamA